MKKYRAMKKIKELLNLSVIFVIVLLCFSKVATACPHPPCNPCYEWDGETEQCVWDCSSGQTCCGGTTCCDIVNCCNGSCCGSFQDCCGGECCYPWNCCGGQCCDVGCCEDSDCGPPGCWDCVNCSCEYQCDPAKCETCVDGSCKVCGGDPDQSCCTSDPPPFCMPKCTQTETANCNQIEETPCPECFDILWYKCPQHETTIPLDAPIYYCSGGCPGDPGDPFNPPDCDWEEIDCSKKYECMSLADLMADCKFDNHVGRRRCVAYAGCPTCYECEPNLDTLVIGWTLSKRCE